MITRIKSIKPMFNGIVTTCNKYAKDQLLAGTNLVDTTKADTIKEYQTVVAVGPMVKGIEVGDTVFINPKRYAVKKHKEGTLKDGIITDNKSVMIKKGGSDLSISGDPLFANSCVTLFVTQELRKFIC